MKIEDKPKITIDQHEQTGNIKFVEEPTKALLPGWKIRLGLYLRKEGKNSIEELTDAEINSLIYG